MPRKKSSRRRRSYSSRSSLGTALRRPIVQISILVVVAIVIFLIASMGGEQSSNTDMLPASVSVDEAHQMYTDGTFVLDVRTPEEWNEFHAPNTTLIPLDELASRINELPKDQPILVVCRSGNRSQTGRDILVQAGFNATSMVGGLNAWRDSGYPVVSGP
ncbi:MAG: rhodanese-like domain-containing protein [Anaerolineales bacterium]|jgi:rhodanese-related sulfurtransferase